MKGRTKRQLITAGTTFGAALSIGFVMQYGDAVAGLGGFDTPVTGPSVRLDGQAGSTPVAANMAVVSTLSTPPMRKTPQAPAQPSAAPFALPEVDAPTLSVPAVDNSSTQSAKETQTGFDPSDFAPNPATADEKPDFLELQPLLGGPVGLNSGECDTKLSLTAMDLAIVRLELSNPCRALSIVAIHHQGLMFQDITDADGNLVLDMPVMAQEAFVIASFDDGEGAVAMTGVPSLAQYDRAALQWQGENNLQLHALEYGANYNEEGHVWQDTPSSPTQAAAGLGGFLTKLGNPNVPDAMLAEVYTFPSGRALQDGSVALSVEAEVTQRNCGRELQAQSLQVTPQAEPQAVDLVVTLPDCNAVGEFLVLKNMFEDLTLAAK